MKKTEEILNQSKKVLLDTLVEMEWKAFDKVDGIEGRASCQEDFETFQIMRSSQFSPWSPELLTSYMEDFRLALTSGRNLITEKYGYMMKSTDPTYFQEIESMLPPISGEKSAIIEEIIKKQLAFMMELTDKYPCFVGQGRTLTTDQDSLYDTSYETYLRGELCTYGDKTLGLYLKMLDDHKDNGLNTAKLYMEEVAKQYGYPDVESAEQQLRETSSI